MLALMWLVVIGQSANTAWYGSQSDRQSGVFLFDIFCLAICFTLAVCATVDNW